MAGYLRFRRTLRLAPGVRLNLSKSGLSTSFGPRGFHYTAGHGRRRTTVGVPGTGLSYTTYSHAHARAATRSTTSPRANPTPPQTSSILPATAGTFAQLAAMTPPQKIRWGILYIVLVITAPVGLWLLIAGLWQLHVPKWRIRTLVRRASLQPANASQLLADAAAADPHNPEVLGPLAELRSSQGDDGAALALYREYCSQVPTDWLARGHLAMAALKCNQLDEAIAALLSIREGASTTDDSMASVTAHLAYAYLCKEDPEQALSFVVALSLRAHTLGPGGQQALFYRAVCRYMLGHTIGAVADLDRLYVMNPAYQGIEAAKDAMVAGTYELLLADGSVLVPVTPGHATRAAVAVQRRAPQSAHCLDCQAPLPARAVECAYCHAAVTATGPSAPPASPALPPPPAPPG